MRMLNEANQEVTAVEDIRAAAQKIAANCRGERLEGTLCPGKCPGLTACGLAGFKPAQDARP